MHQHSMCAAHPTTALRPAHITCLQVALRTKGIQFSQYPVENEASLRNTLHQLLADSVVSSAPEQGLLPQPAASRQAHQHVTCVTTAAAAVATWQSGRSCPPTQCCLPSEAPAVQALTWHLRDHASKASQPLPNLLLLQELRTVVLLNCGASTHVKALAPASCRNARFIIIDSHRPIHPRYNDKDDTDALLVLTDDDPLPLQDIPPANEDLDNMPAKGEQQQQH